MENTLVELRYPISQNSTMSIEAFKMLRTNLIYSEGLQVIAITSTLPNEGKTVASYNLACSFAQMDKRVLLIDCDLRKGSLRKFFVPHKKIIGLSEALTGQSGQIIEETTVPNLDVVFSGKIPPNPTELLSSEMFEAIINQLKHTYDYIIIDTPPMNVAMDASIVGRIADGVVMVVRNDFVKKQEVRRTKIQLERNGSRVVGVVLNRVKKDQIDYKDYGYDKYYYNKK